MPTVSRCPSCGAEPDSGGVTYHTTMCTLFYDNAGMSVSGGELRLMGSPDIPDPLTMGILRNLVAMHYVAANRLRFHDRVQPPPSMHDIVRTVLGRFPGMIWPAGTVDALVASLSEELS